MSGSDLVQAHHLSRKAIIYVRQSTRHQVLTNTESARLQREMQKRAIALGWHADRTEVVDADSGQTAATTAGRDEYKNILAEVALGHVGIVISYDSARVSRNCTDWYPLLDLCAARQCLIADRDGVYDPATPNGRLLLGMKGIVSELELHTLRGRLLAGVESKARRGEFACMLPTGYIRLEDGRVVKEPNLQVQEAIDLVFRTFFEHRTASQVVSVFRKQGVLVPRRHDNDQIVWRQPSMGNIITILRNPVYAGAYAFGKTSTVREVTPAGNLRRKQTRRQIEECRVVIKDHHPGYISWEQFEKIRNTLRDNHAEYLRKSSRGVARQGAALLPGILYCGRCGHKLGVQYRTNDDAFYVCRRLHQEYRMPVCQYLRAEPVDEHVTQAFFEALAPAELDLYDAATKRCENRNRDFEIARERELQRLRYEADLARRQFDRVDPDNRLVASELERRWERALADLRRTEERLELEKQRREKILPLAISRDDRQAFESLGKSLPLLWKKPGALAPQQRKALLRCLIDKVVIQRTKSTDRLAVRIVWRGGAVSAAEIPVRVSHLRHLSHFPEMENLIIELARAGNSDEEIAATLTQRGFRSAKNDDVTASTVTAIRHRCRVLRWNRKPRSPRPADMMTVPELATATHLSRDWIYEKIWSRTIRISKDETTGLYYFPRTPKTVQDILALKAGTVRSLTYKKLQGVSR